MCITVCVCVCVRAQLCQILYLSMEFSRQEYWGELPFLTPGDRPDLGIQPVSLVSPALAGGFFTTMLPGKTL